MPIYFVCITVYTYTYKYYFAGRAKTVTNVPIVQEINESALISISPIRNLRQEKQKCGEPNFKVVNSFLE